MPTTGGLKQALTQQALRQLAGARSFERGEDYFDSGQVISLVEHAGRLTAKVQGTDEYQVTLSAAADTLDYDCTCPMGADGAFCKHCVAVGLAWLASASGASAGKPARTAPTPLVTLDDVRVWLGKQDKTKLIEMVLEQAAQDDRLRERLLLQAAKAAGKNVNVAAIRKALERATRTGGFVDYRASHDFSAGIDRVVTSIADLLKEGYAAEVIELTEDALPKVEQATMQTDDSGGYMGMILDRLQELHHAACRKAKPDPEKLAGRLFRSEMQTQFSTFYGAAATYADVLGERGLAAYRQCAEAEWARVPQIGPGQKDPEEFGRTYHIRHIMETLAKQSGDVDALVVIKSRDLSNAHAFLEIAGLYREAKRHDDALTWAERGLKCFPEKSDARLREFLADEYHRRQRHDEAMQLVWATFAEQPCLAPYQKLQQHADRIGQWPQWREKALARLRADLEREKKEAARKPRGIWSWSPRHPDPSTLVEIFLWEKDAEAAWREAQSGGCSDHLWMQLARCREKDFPADAIPVYQKQAEVLINQKNNGSYAEAVKLLRKIRDLMTGLGRSEDSAHYLASVRTAHKPKRNFIKLAERL